MRSLLHKTLSSGLTSNISKNVPLRQRVSPCNAWLLCYRLGFLSFYGSLRTSGTSFTATWLRRKLVHLPLQNLKLERPTTPKLALIAGRERQHVLSQSFVSRIKLSELLNMSEEQAVESSQGLTEGEENEETPTEVLEEFTLGEKDIEELFNKNTESFRCLTQLLISHSSLLRQPLYHFPPLEDPGIDDAFNYVGKLIWFRRNLGLYFHFQHRNSNPT